MRSSFTIRPLCPDPSAMKICLILQGSQAFCTYLAVFVDVVDVIVVRRELAGVHGSNLVIPRRVHTKTRLKTSGPCSSAASKAPTSRSILSTTARFNDRYDMDGGRLVNALKQTEGNR